MEEYLIPAKAAEAEYLEKKSRFIGNVFPVSSEEEVRACLEQIRKKHYDARHHCYCYRLSSGVVRASDGGEPQGTAGQPMLAVFTRENVQDVLCVVTRYFGGILLGAGGLTRAYAKTAKDALDAAGIAKRCVWDVIEIPCSYAFLERAKLELAAQDGVIEAIDYGAQILIRASLPQEHTAALCARLRELSAGSVAVMEVEKTYRASVIK